MATILFFALVACVLAGWATFVVGELKFRREIKKLDEKVQEIDLSMLADKAAKEDYKNYGVAKAEHYALAEPKPRERGLGSLVTPEEYYRRNRVWGYCHQCGQYRPCNERGEKQCTHDSDLYRLDSAILDARTELLDAEQRLHEAKREMRGG